MHLEPLLLSIWLNRCIFLVFVVCAIMGWKGIVGEIDSEATNCLAGGYS